MSERINGKLLRRAFAATRERGETDCGVSEETFQFWKGNSGNAKARRRWRRRNVLNTQRLIAQAEALRITPGGGNGVTLTAKHKGNLGDVLP